MGLAQDRASKLQYVKDGRKVISKDEVLPSHVAIETGDPHPTRADGQDKAIDFLPSWIFVHQFAEL
jgi:hypothetical protein